MFKKAVVIGINVSFAFFSFNSFAGPVSDNTVVNIGTYNNAFISPGLEELVGQKITISKDKNELA